jgi:hypothetical protein
MFSSLADAVPVLKPSLMPNLQDTDGRVVFRLVSAFVAREGDKYPQGVYWLMRVKRTSQGEYIFGDPVDDTICVFKIFRQDKVADDDALFRKRIRPCDRGPSGEHFRIAAFAVSG